MLNFEIDFNCVDLEGFRWPRQGKLTFQQVGNFATHRPQGQFAHAGAAGTLKIGDMKVKFKINNKLTEVPVRL